MSAANFDSFMNSQFPPHIETWYEYDLDAEFEYIEPASAVGSMAVEIRHKLIDTAIAHDDAEQLYGRELDQDPDDPDADDISALKRDCELAQARDKVFRGMYFDMSAFHETGREGHRIPGGYHGVVSGALDRGIKELDRVWIPPGSKPELVSFNKELSSFLGFESDLHFRAINRES